MAVTKGTDNNANNAMGDAFQKAHTQATGAAGTQQQAPQMEAQRQQTQNPRQQARRGMVDLNSTMRRPMSRKSTGEIVQKYQDALKAQMNRNFKQGFENAFQLLVLDNNVSNVGPLSSLLVCYHEQQNGQHYVAVYTLLIEGSSTKLNPKVVNIAGRNVEVETVAGDVFTDYLWNVIKSHITATYGRTLNVLDAGVMVLPDELDPEDDEHVRRVMFNASQACYTVMENNVGGKEVAFNIGEINASSETLVARLDYNPGQAESATGEPIRSDIRITLQGNINGQFTEGGFEQVRELSTVDGYVDLVYTPPGPIAPGQLPVTQHYHPRFVITRADTEVDAITMELQLLALTQATLLTRNMAWAGAFRQRHHVKGLDTRDIGAVGWEVNLTGDPAAKMEAVATKAKSFGDNELYQLITMTVHDKLIYSMDIEEVGELSWIHQAFAAAANGNQDAYRLIIDAANNLTMGHFGQVFPGGPVAYDERNRIHLGYYVDEQGVRRDIREIDYLAMLNIAGKDDPSLVVRWGETFDNKDIPLEIRLEERANILKTVFSQTVHIKGYARRITFDPNFMIALNVACSNAGLVIRPDRLIQEFTGGTVRGNFNAAQYGINSQQISTLFNYGASNPWGNHQGGLNTGFQGRFGRF